MEEENANATVPFVEQQQPVFLHLGGLPRASRSGWTIVNAFEEGADVVASIASMPSFPNDSVAAIYCSHTLEHLPHWINESENVYAALSEWHRILRHGSIALATTFHHNLSFCSHHHHRYPAPGGALFVSVPDLAVLSRLFVNDSLSTQERFEVTKMIYGSQMNPYEYHKV